MILRGERQLTLAHVRTLSKHFSVSTVCSFRKRTFPVRFYGWNQTGKHRRPNRWAPSKSRTPNKGASAVKLNPQLNGDQIQNGIRA
jgi:hypothetical protein